MVSVANGNIYLPNETFDTYFKGIEAVALLPHEQGILMLPLHNSAGGLLVKLKNLRGDRVVNAQEFFRTGGFSEDASETEHSVRWLSERGGLLIEQVQKSDPVIAN